MYLIYNHFIPLIIVIINGNDYKEREIWWCRIGVNVGHEEDGKGEDFHRPVLIVKKFNKRLFWGVPATTKIKDDSHYFPTEFDGRLQSLMLTHLRLYDASRLQGKVKATLSHKQFEALKKALIHLL